jgi:purine-nucleoside phosphorylase
MGINQPALGDPKKVLEITLGCAPEDLPEKVIITPFIPLKSFRRHVDAGSIKELNPQFFFKGFTATHKGVKVAVILTGVGPSRIGDMVSILSLTPVKEVLFAGAVGALHPEWAIGEYFLATGAADGEGFARYMREDFATVVDNSPYVECSFEMEGALEKFLEKKELPVRVGKVFTIGSIGAESQENLELLAARGFDALEMELSAFYWAAHHHGLKGGALTYISDLPLRSSIWEEKSEAEREAFRDVWRGLPEVCLDFMAES